MQILNILSGVAVLFTTLAFGHLLHRYLVVALEGGVPGLAFWVSISTAGVVGIFSFIGAVMLLRGGR